MASGVRESIFFKDVVPSRLTTFQRMAHTHEYVCSTKWIQQVTKKSREERKLGKIRDIRVDLGEVRGKSGG